MTNKNFILTDIIIDMLYYNTNSALFPNFILKSLDNKSM